MILLNRGYFYPMLILLSILFLPMIALGFLWLFSESGSMPIFAISILTIIYFILIWLIKKISKSTKYFLICSAKDLEIHYPNITKDNSALRIENKDVIQFDYCRLFSIKAWFLIPFYDLPQCVFMTFMENNVKVCKLIGYMSYSDIRKLADKTNITLIIH